MKASPYGGIRPIPTDATHWDYPDHGGVAMPPTDPPQHAGEDPATQLLLLGSELSDPTDDVSRADTSGHPADEKREGKDNAPRGRAPAKRRRRSRVTDSEETPSRLVDENTPPSGQMHGSATPPPPGWGMLTPAYQAAWLAHVARDVLVVVRDPEAGARDGEIDYQLYAVDEKTGRLERGELMTHYRAKASDAYLLSAGTHLSGPGQQAEFIACARHALEMKRARSVSAITANVGMSLLTFPALWADIPVCTPQDLDADLSVIGMPSGVWFIPAHRFLSPAEARLALCSTAIRSDYDPNAGHPEAIALFEYLYGDLKDTTTMAFARWRQAATALVRRPMQEVIVKIAESQSAKTTENLLQEHAFWPLVVQGDRAAIEERTGWNSGGAMHNSYLASFARPARRVNVSEISTRDRKAQKLLSSQLLRDLSESSTITYRNPGPHRYRSVPFDAHLFIDGNVPAQGSDILQIADPGSDSAVAIMHRLRGSPYTHIPKEAQRPELRNYGDPTRGATAEQAAEIAQFNCTVVRLMCDGMAEYWDLLQQPLPQDAYSQSLIQQLQTRGQPEWLAQWVPYALKPAGPGDEPTDTLAIYKCYLAWHDEHGEGERPAKRRAVTEAVKRHYRLQPGEAGHGYLDGKRTATQTCPAWALATV